MIVEYFRSSQIFFMSKYFLTCCAGALGLSCSSTRGREGATGAGAGGTSSQSQPQWPLSWQQVGKGGLRMSDVRY